MAGGQRRSPYIRWLGEIGLEDADEVGAKNAWLGEMARELAGSGVRVPEGFALTAAACRHFLCQSGLDRSIPRMLAGLRADDDELAERAFRVRHAILAVPLPVAVEDALLEAYDELCAAAGRPVDVAVRSSAATGEAAGAEPARQHETYLNVRGGAPLLDASKRCFASLFTDRALAHRVARGRGSDPGALSVGVQRMVRSDLATSGAMLSSDERSGLSDAVRIRAAYGLGESVAQAAVEPDEYTVFKPTLKRGFRPILERRLGSKELRVIYDEGGGKNVRSVPVAEAERAAFALGDDEILALAHTACVIEEHFGARTGRRTPLEIEWAVDGRTGELFVVQARPETAPPARAADPAEVARLPAAGALPRPRTRVMLDLSEPGDAHRFAALPCDGVGRLRLGRLLETEVGIHPLALLEYPDLDAPELRTAIERRTGGGADAPRYLVDRLARGVARVAAAFHPRDVIVSLSDLRSDAYARLLGGRRYEAPEPNPALGLRGASRYLHARQGQGFALECRALVAVRDEMGLENLKLAVPFCRTPDEGRRVLASLDKHGLCRGDRGLEVYLLCELPSHAVRAEEFAQVFDGFSIASDAFAALVLGIDPDAERADPTLAARDPAVLELVASAIRAAKRAGRPVGICGRAPGDDPGLADLGVEHGIDFVSVAPGALLATSRRILEREAALDAPDALGSGLREELWGGPLET